MNENRTKIHSIDVTEFASDIVILLWKELISRETFFHLLTFNMEGCGRRFEHVKHTTMHIVQRKHFFKIHFRISYKILKKYSLAISDNIFRNQ